MTMTPRVADLYHDDAVTSFAEAAAAGIWGIIHKASQGASASDHTYADRRAAATSAGLKWGAYHFGTSEDPEAQVSHFLAVAAPAADTLLVLDWEPGRSAAATMSKAQAKRFLALLCEKSGREPGTIAIYGGELLREALGPDDKPFFGQFKLWLSQYGPHCHVPACWDRTFLWQYTGDGEGPAPHGIAGIPGTHGVCDLSSYQGTRAQFDAEWAGSLTEAVAAPGLPTIAPTQETPAAAPPIDLGTHLPVPAAAIPGHSQVPAGARVIVGADGEASVAVLRKHSRKLTLLDRARLFLGLGAPAAGTAASVSLPDLITKLQTLKGEFHDVAELVQPVLANPRFLCICLAAVAGAAVIEAIEHYHLADFRAGRWLPSGLAGRQS